MRDIVRNHKAFEGFKTKPVEFVRNAMNEVAGGIRALQHQLNHGLVPAMSGVPNTPINTLSTRALMNTADETLSRVVGKGTGNLIRKEAFNNAKDLAGVPRSQQPTRQWQVGDNINRKGGEYKNYEYSSNPTHHGRYYEYDTPQGKRVIVEHINDGRLHTHAGKPKDGANPFEYDFKKERYSNIYGPNGDHHIYYNR